MTCEAAVRRRGFDLALEVPAGQRLAVLGPNGSGKSTLLQVLAGVLRPDAGRATLDDRVLFDLGANRWTPPHRRGIALLAQDALLFPHLSVLDNVAFAPRVAGRSKRDATALAEHWLSQVDALPLAGSRPGQLSGGQAQRVAIARALAAEPRLLLLDEPMASLDVAVAPALRRLLRRVLAERTSLIVTHDPLDALLLSDRVIVLEGGRIVESGRTEDVLRHPRAGFTARLAGLNLITGRLVAGSVEAAGGLHLDGTTRAATDLAEGDPVAAAFAPAEVSIYLSAPSGSPRNNLAVTLTELEPHGDLIRARGEGLGGHSMAADVTRRSVADLDLYPGRRVTFSIKAAGVTIYPM